jgi:hypothetical protein
MATISDKIIRIEQQLDLKRFQYKGENVWPVIRMAIYLSSTKSTSSGVSPLRSIMFLLSSAFYFFARLILDLSSRHYDAVLVTTSHYKVKELGKVYDKIIDPVIQYLKKKGRKFVVLEFTGKFKYDENITYSNSLIKIQKEIYFLSFLRRLAKPFRGKHKLTGDVEKLNSLLEQYEISFQVNNAFVNKLELIFFQAGIFKRFLKKHSVKRVFVVCYYDVKCFSVVLAANRLGLRSIDLQHGVQGQNHLAYANWPTEISANTNFLPSHFYVWDASAFKTIEQWKTDSSQILVGCNKWILDRAKKVANDIILVTLQPIEDYFPDYLLDMIKTFRGDKKWFIRLHPRQHDQIGQIEKLLEQAGLNDLTDVRNASELPLTELLERTVLHVTFYSSVVIEASYYNIPTYFLKASGMSYYSGTIDNSMMYHYPTHNIAQVVADIEASTVKSVDYNGGRINVLDNFIND